MSTLLDLPIEITIKVLCHLSLNDLAACQLTHSSLHCIVASSPRVQYYLAIQIAAVEDNNNSKLGVHERLAKLLIQEEGWNTAQCNFSQTLEIGSPKPWIRGYEVNSGVLCLTAETRTALRWSKLPILQDAETAVLEVLQWKTIEFGERIGVLGFGIEEHDLLTVVIRSASHSSPILRLL